MHILLLKKYRYTMGRLLAVLFYVFAAGHLQGQITALSTVNPVGANPLEVTFLNVGQGNCVLVKFPSGKFLLYDAGTSSSKTKIDKGGVAARVAALTGGAPITTVILSHPDKDHINIVPLILQAAHPMYVHYSGIPADYDHYLDQWFNNLAPPPATTLVPYANNYPVVPFVINPSAQVDGSAPVQVYVLAANIAGDVNSKSVVVQIKYGTTSIMLTGDATAGTEAAILAKWPAAFLKSTVILFSHHGSNYSSITPFITAVNPNIGIWSASATHKGYGHPRCDVLAVAGVMVDSTTKNGVTIQPHTITCYDTPAGHYVNSVVSDAFFLTAKQGDIKFRSDGTNYSVIVNSLN